MLKEYPTLVSKPATWIESLQGNRNAGQGAFEVNVTMLNPTFCIFQHHLGHTIRLLVSLDGHLAIDSEDVDSSAGSAHLDILHQFIDRLVKNTPLRR